MKTFKYWLPPLIWACLIFTFSSLKVTPSSEIYWQDFLLKKTAHFIEYSLLFILLYRAFKNTTTLDLTRVGLFALLGVLAYAISDEFHQSFTPGREPTVRDVFIDSFSGVIAWILISKFLPKAPKKLLNLAKNFQVL